MNRTEDEVSYELKGGPLRMTMSTCTLLPGEEEIWTSPYRRQVGVVRCELHVTAGEVTAVIDAPDDATVLIEPEGAGLRLRVA